MKLKTTRPIRMKTREKTPNPNKFVQLNKNFPPFFLKQNFHRNYKRVFQLKNISKYSNWCNLE